MNPAPLVPGAKCGLCTRILPLGISLSAHVEAAHMDVVASYNCKFCQKKNFVLKDEFLAHVEEAHRSAFTEGETLGASNGNKEKEASRVALASGYLGQFPEDIKQKDDEISEREVASDKLDVDGTMSEEQDNSSDSPEDGSAMSEASERNQTWELVKSEASHHGLISDINKQEEGKERGEINGGIAAPETPMNKFGTNSEGNKNQCTLCGKVFAQRGSLRQHVKAVHMGIREHVCNVCCKAFTQGHNLKLHVAQIHGQAAVHKTTTPTNNAGTNGSRTLKNQCPICSKVFTQKEHLQVHVATVHRGIRPHVCKECGAAYTQGHNLKSHAAKVHGQVAPKNRVRGGSAPVIIGIKRKQEVQGDGPKEAKGGDGFETKFDMYRHRCDICWKVYPYKNMLAEHRNAVHHLGVKAHKFANRSGHDKLSHVEGSDE